MGLFDRFRRRESASPDVSAWWRSANALTTAPTADAIAALASAAVSADLAPDVAEAQHEMLEGLGALVAFQAADVPIVQTQHRVIGSDACHYMAPASLIAEVDAGGKVFVTSARIIFASGSVASWPWHLISRIRREERDLVIDLKGRPAVRLRVNTYQDALLIEALVVRLAANRP